MHREIILCIHYGNICSKALLKHKKKIITIKKEKKHMKFLSVTDKGVTNGKSS